ncbi:hypothetical protein [Rhodovulum imhoffii]|uniref:hypothetical protein n=1 Tax=Rhodovulum imhoffii TaxID=365340 RepID=UPI001474ED6D|nr:hypothetical protein [Rhodovulum imhoffii]
MRFPNKVMDLPFQLLFAYVDSPAAGGKAAARFYPLRRAGISGTFVPATGAPVPG